jgi:hypothetical protein
VKFFNKNSVLEIARGHSDASIDSILFVDSKAREQASFAHSLIFGRLGKALIALSRFHFGIRIRESVWRHEQSNTAEKSRIYILNFTSPIVGAYDVFSSSTHCIFDDLIFER